MRSGDGERLVDEARESIRASIGQLDYYHQILTGLRGLVGCDGAAFRPGSRWPGSRAYYLDEDTRFTDGYIRNADRYRPEVTTWCDLSKGAGAFIDTEIYSSRERSKKALYADVVKPCGVRSIMGCPLTVQGEVVALVLLIRTGKVRSFRADQTQAINPLLNALAVAEKSLAQPRLPAPILERIHALPRRFAPVFRLLLTGRSEKEISLVTTLSVRSVHKYTEQIFRLFGVRSRPELMALFVNPVEPLTDLR